MTHTTMHYIPRGMEDRFFDGLKKLIEESGVNIPDGLWRIQLMAQPTGVQPPYAEVFLTRDDTGGRS